MSHLPTQESFAEIQIPVDALGTASYTIRKNGKANESNSLTSVYISLYPDQSAYRELPSSSLSEKIGFVLKSTRIPGLNLGNARISDDFDAPLSGDLGFAEE